MSDSLSFFDEVARIGSVILKSLGGDTRKAPVKRYLDEVAKIYVLLSMIHDRIAEVAAKTSKAKGILEARHILEDIKSYSLEETFRLHHWCDKLQKLGFALEPLIKFAKLSKRDRKIWAQFCHALELREGEVAFLYDMKLIELRRLDELDSLEDLKQKAMSISNHLVTQKNKFDDLAKRADTMLKRLL